MSWRAVAVASALCLAAPAAGQPLGSPFDSAALFDQVWHRFDEVYAAFAHKGVDWDEFHARHRPRFERLLTPEEFARELATALAELRDLHVNVRGPDGAFLPVYVPDRPLTVPAQPRNRYRIAAYETLGDGAVIHTTLLGGVAYIRIDTLLNERFADIDETAVDALFARYAGAPGLIIDLRANSGGNELYAQWFATRVADEARLFGAVRYRTGPGRDELSEPFLKLLEPAGDHRYTGPVAVLIGPTNMSSAEWFALMLDVQPHVTLVGAPTAGSSGNPEWLELANGVSVSIPRWLALRPDGEPLEGNGIAPDVLVPTGASFDAFHDYVLERALELLGVSIGE